MSFFYSKARQARNLASSDEVHAVFEKESEDLHWFARVITGNMEIANKSVVDASGLAPTTTGVFREWLIRWAHSATARVAAEAMRTEISAAALKYSDWSCSHLEHAVLSPEQVAFIRAWDPLTIASNLDALQRSVLVLRGIQDSSVAHCALLLNVPRRCVLAAYCSVLQWVCQQENTKSTGRFVEDGSGNHYSDKVQTNEIRESYPSKGIFQHVRTAVT